MLNQNVKALRENLGLSRGGFSRLIGVSWQTCKNWEEGKNIPSPLSKEKIKIAADLGVNWQTRKKIAASQKDRK